MDYFGRYSLHSQLHSTSACLRKLFLSVLFAPAERNPLPWKREIQCKGESTAFPRAGILSKFAPSSQQLVACHSVTEENLNLPLGFFRTSGICRNSVSSFGENTQQILNFKNFSSFSAQLCAAATKARSIIIGIFIRA